jgi:hypothetical protein
VWVGDVLGMRKVVTGAQLIVVTLGESERNSFSRRVFFRVSSVCAGSSFLLRLIVSVIVSIIRMAAQVTRSQVQYTLLATQSDADTHEVRIL